LAESTYSKATAVVPQRAVIDCASKCFCDAAAVDTRDSFENELTSAKVSRQNDGLICDPQAGRSGHGNLKESNYGPAASSNASAERQ